jgi:hypothetical protein
VENPPDWYTLPMAAESSSLSDWTPEQIDQGRRWVTAWREAGAAMERLRRVELRALDGRREVEAIAHLCGPADYREPPRAPKATSGLVEQQRWFMKAARR